MNRVENWWCHNVGHKCAYIDTNKYPCEQESSLVFTICLPTKYVATVKWNQPTTINGVNEAIRDTLILSKSKSAVSTCSVQQASFLPTAAFQILSWMQWPPYKTQPHCCTSLLHALSFFEFRKLPGSHVGCGNQLVKVWSKRCVFIPQKYKTSKISSEGCGGVEAFSWNFAPLNISCCTVISQKYVRVWWL